MQRGRGSGASASTTHPCPLPVPQPCGPLLSSLAPGLDLVPWVGRRAGSGGSERSTQAGVGRHPLVALSAIPTLVFGLGRWRWAGLRWGAVWRVNDTRRLPGTQRLLRNRHCSLGFGRKACFSHALSPRLWEYPEHLGKYIGSVT